MKIKIEVEICDHPKYCYHNMGQCQYLNRSNLNDDYCELFFQSVFAMQNFNIKTQQKLSDMKIYKCPQCLKAIKQQANE